MSYPIPPAPQEDSYGTVEGVAAYVGVYTDDGTFNATTTPTFDRVVIWIDQVSDMFNVALASAGFTTPITQEDATSAIAGTVEEIVADLVHMANTKGRFFSKTFQASGKSVMGSIWQDIDEWVKAHSDGFVNLGVPRTKGTIGQIGSKGVDSAGDPMYPFTQRKAFGNKVPDWSKQVRGIQDVPKNG